MIIPGGGAGVNYALETGGNLAALAAEDFATQTTLAALAAEDFSTETTLALVKAKTDNLDIAISALRDAITDGVAPKDLKDLYDQLVLLVAKDFATQTTLAALAAEDFATQTTLAALAAEDFATQTTLALIKAKTDNLDVALSTKALEAGGNLALIEGWTEELKLNNIRAAATFTNLFAVTMTTADTEYSQALTATTKQLTFLVRDGTAFRYAWVTGKVATPTDPYISVPANGVVCFDQLFLSSKTLYFACGVAGKILQIEAIG